jgi:hypothetical protein
LTFTIDGHSYNVNIALTIDNLEPAEGETKIRIAGNIPDSDGVVTLTGTEGMTGNVALVATDAYGLPLTGGT